MNKVVTESESKSVTAHGIFNTNINNISNITNITNTNIDNISNISSIINNFHISNVHNTDKIDCFDTLSAVPTDSDCRTDFEKFSYVRIEAGNKEKFDFFGMKKSNTGHYECPIPLKNAIKIQKNNKNRDYLRLYIGYIEHIPIKN